MDLSGRLLKFDGTLYIILGAVEDRRELEGVFPEHMLSSFVGWSRVGRSERDRLVSMVMTDFAALQGAECYYIFDPARGRVKWTLGHLCG